MKIRNWLILAFFAMLSVTILLQVWGVISYRLQQTIFWVSLPVLVGVILIDSTRRRT